MLERALALGAVVSLLLGAGMLLKDDPEAAPPSLPGPRFLDEPPADAPPAQPPPQEQGPPPVEEPEAEREDKDEEKKDEGKGKAPRGLLGPLLGASDEDDEDPDGDDD